MIRCNAALTLLQQAAAAPAGTLIASQSDGHPEVVVRSSIGGPISGKVSVAVGGTYFLVFIQMLRPEPEVRVQTHPKCLIIVYSSGLSNSELLA